MVIGWILYGPKAEWRAEARHSDGIKGDARSVLRRVLARRRRRRNQAAGVGHAHLLADGERSAVSVGDGQRDVEDPGAEELVQQELSEHGRAAVPEVPTERVRRAAERIAVGRVRLEADVLGVLAVGE